MKHTFVLFLAPHGLDYYADPQWGKLALCVPELEQLFCLRDEAGAMPEEIEVEISNRRSKESLPVRLVNVHRGRCEIDKGKGFEFVDTYWWPAKQIESFNATVGRESDAVVHVKIRA